MKRFFILLFSIVIILIAGCGQDADTAGTPEPDNGLETDEPATDIPDDDDDAVIDTDTAGQEPDDDANADADADLSSFSGTQQGYAFEHSGVQIFVCMPAQPVLDSLPATIKPNFEAPSCAFEGTDITYFYPGFELTTYPDNGSEYILSVLLIDDSVMTPEGIHLGMSYDDMQKAYGTDYIEDGSRFIYTKGQGNLIFNYMDGIIIAITYMMITD